MNARIGIVHRFLQYLTLKTAAHYLQSGEASLSRDQLGASSTLTSGVGRITCFIAAKSETISGVRVSTTGTAAGATPTLVRIGIYEADVDSPSAVFTLVGSTANDTALLAAANTRYSKALQSSFTKVAGRRYAVMVLVVTGATAPTLSGSVAGVGSGAEFLEWPLVGGSITGLTDLPASFVVSDLAAASSSVARPYVALTP